MKYFVVLHFDFITKILSYMTSTIIYILWLIAGLVGFVYYLYKDISRNNVTESNKGVRKNSWLPAFFSGITVVPVLHLTEKLLSSYITNELELFFVQLLIIMAIVVVVAIPVRLIARRK